MEDGYKVGLFAPEKKEKAEKPKEEKPKKAKK